MSDLKIEDLITDFEFFDNWEDKYKSVSYTHLTLPTICSV